MFPLSKETPDAKGTKTASNRDSTRIPSRMVYDLFMGVKAAP